MTNKFEYFLIAFLIMFSFVLTQNNTDQRIKKEKEREIQQEIKKIREDNNWNRYFKQNTKKLHRYNMNIDNDSLMDIIGHPGTAVDRTIPKRHYDNTNASTNNNINKRRNTKMTRLLKRLITQLPNKRKCVKFRQQLIGRCGFQRKLLQINNRIVVDNPDAERILRSRLQSKKYTNAGHRKNFKTSRIIRKVMRKLLLKATNVSKFKSHALTKHEVNSITDNRKLQGMPIAPGLVAGAAPQITDPRIIIHSFAAPPKMNNNMMHFDDEMYPKTIEAHITVPPKNFIV